MGGRLLVFACSVSSMFPYSIFDIDRGCTPCFCGFYRPHPRRLGRAMIVHFCQYDWHSPIQVAENFLGPHSTNPPPRSPSSPTSRSHIQCHVARPAWHFPPSYTQIRRRGYTHARFTYYFPIPKCFSQCGVRCMRLCPLPSDVARRCCTFGCIDIRSQRAVPLVCPASEARAEVMWPSAFGAFCATIATVHSGTRGVGLGVYGR